MLKTTVQQLIEQHEILLKKREEEVKKLEHLWNVKGVSSEYMGDLPEINNEIHKFLATELEIKE